MKPLCTHDATDVVTDFLEGIDRILWAVSWCRRCGAYRRVAKLPCNSDNGWINPCLLLEIDEDKNRWVERAKQLEQRVRCLEIKHANDESGRVEEHCGKSTKYHLIAGASSYACMLPPNHDGECQPGGNCAVHGKYVGAMQCPKWPECIKDVFASHPQPSVKEK